MSLASLAMITTKNKTSLEKNKIPVDIKSLLQNEFLKRYKNNPRYSIRAFANHLQVDSSSLSQMIRGTRKISSKMQTKLLVRLGLSPAELELFSKQNQAACHDLNLDTFQMISDWYHHAIYELVTLKNFKTDEKWISRKLGISITEARVAIERLIRLELIQVDKEGVWHQRSPQLSTTGNPFTAAAFKNFQSQVIEMAGRALMTIPFEQRDQSSTTIAMSADKLPEVKERIKKFRRELCDYLQQDGERDAVFQLGVSFYPLTLNIEETI